MLTRKHGQSYYQVAVPLIQWFSSEISLYCCTMGLTENICVVQRGWVSTLLPNKPSQNSTEM